MLNMIKLDWLAMKCYWKILLVVPLAVCLVGVISEALIMPFAAYTMLSCALYPFVAEEKGKLDNLYLTLPVTRKNIVNARFGLSLIMLLAGIVIGLVSTFIMSSVLQGITIRGMTHNFQPEFSTFILLIGISLFFFAVMHLSMFPILFKLGYVKGKVLGFYIPVIGTMAIFYVVFYLFLSDDAVMEQLNAVASWAAANPYGLSAILTAASVLLLALSVLLSYKTYGSREF